MSSNFLWLTLSNALLKSKREHSLFVHFDYVTEQNCWLLLQVVSHRNVVYGNHVASRSKYLLFQDGWLYDWKGRVPWFCMFWVYLLLCKLGWQCLFSSHLVLFSVSMMHWRVERRHQQLPRHILSRRSVMLSGPHTFWGSSFFKSLMMPFLVKWILAISDPFGPSMFGVMPLSFEKTLQ